MEHELLAGTICITSKTHEASNPNELSFQKGDVVTIVSERTKDDGYYQATAADGSIALVPSSAILKRTPILLRPMFWFHGSISRFDAEKMLDRNQDGQFLLRTSQNTRGVYALALTLRGRVNHYLVAMDFRTRKLTVDGKRYFDSLPGLVEYYKSNGEDLGTALKRAVTRRGVLDFYIDQGLLKQQWGLPQSEITVGEVIGHGEFGEVHTGVYRGTQVALKGLNESKQTAIAVSTFFREAAVMSNLRHKNLVQMVGVVFKGSALRSIALEVMGKGSLQKYLISRGRSVISPMELLSFARDVCAGMVYVSSKGFVHRDLATRNVLLNSNGQAKISDFGLARKADIHVPHEGGKFPVKWTAPEALKDSRFSAKSDVWSFGIFLWELYSYGRTPYPSIPVDELLGDLEDGYMMDPPENCPKGIYDIMCRCWEMEATERPSFLALQQMLQKNFGESSTPCASPLPSKKLTVIPDVEELVMSPVATQAYREAPISRKSTMFVANIIFTGPQGGGKTSLMRCFTGQPFRLMEPPTQKVSITDSYCELKTHVHWFPSTAGLMYEDELVRIIVEDLLKHAQLMLSSSDPKPPPLPLRRRSQSFTMSQGFAMLADSDTTKAASRLSGSFEVIESGTLEGQLQLGIRPQPVAEQALASPVQNRRAHKKSFFTRMLTTHLKGFKERGGSVRRHYSDSVRRTNYVDTGAQNGAASPQYYSPLPERLIDKVRNELRECSGGCLPPKYFGKFIDAPGSTEFAALKPLFITENSICILAYDVSKDMHAIASPGPTRKSFSVGSRDTRQNGVSSPTLLENSYLGQIMDEISDLCLHWSQSEATVTLKGPRIILVGTHSDKVSSLVSSHNFEVLRDAIKASPYEKYVAMMKIVISSSSIIERSNVDDLKRIVMETVKKTCRQQVPLRWLRCIRRFQGLSRKGMQFVSLAFARRLISELCDLYSLDDVQAVSQFLHKNQVIIHFPRVHQLKEIVITNPRWFVQQMSAVFAAPWANLGGASELASDQRLLRTKGILTNQLLEYTWREKDTWKNRDELLAVMHKMDLLCCMGPDSLPLSPSASVENIGQDVSSDSTQDASTKKHQSITAVVSSVVIPALVEDPMPSQFLSLPAFKVEPLYFRFKNGRNPDGLFPRLVVRCIASYPTSFSIYQDAATFEVDPTSLLMLTTGKDHIKFSLHRIREETSDPLSTLTPTNLDELMSESRAPNPDTCMAVLMFLQAAISDLIQQWMPHLDYDLCITCACQGRSSEKMHYLVLSDVDNLLQQSSLRCEGGTQVEMFPALTYWFGDAPKVSLEEDIDFVTEEDIGLVSRSLGSSWAELGQILGFSHAELERLSTSAHKRAGEEMLRKWRTVHPQNATFFALLRALEIIQRRDIADGLLAVRMAGDGISI